MAGCRPTSRSSGPSTWAAASTRWPTCATHLTESGLDEVETYIQTGNVRFRSAMRSPARVEPHVERVLGGHVGFDVPSVVLTPAGLREVYDDARRLEPPAFAGEGALRRYVTFFKPGDAPTGETPERSRPGTSRGSRPPWSAARCTSGSRARPRTRGSSAPSRRRSPRGTNRDLKVVTTLAERWGA